ncbi:OsmC family protein [Haliangium sp.]|uniref:OsmC family protein n=1 Tax=Haliangium sp. TaxID=2663208 RepID=UPI003D136C04
MSEHRFTVQASWVGGLAGSGEVRSEGLRTTYSIPANMGGPGAGSNPEELLIAAASSCYLITLAVMLGKAGVTYESLAVMSEGEVLFDKGLQFVRLVHRPRIELPDTATESDRAAALSAAAQAEKGCMVSRAMHGNVEVRVEPELVLAPGTELPRRRVSG